MKRVGRGRRRREGGKGEGADIEKKKKDVCSDARLCFECSSLLHPNEMNGIEKKKKQQAKQAYQHLYTHSERVG